MDLRRNLGVKRSSVGVPERHLRHEGRAPSCYRTKKSGEKRRAKKKRMVAKHSMFFRRDQIPRA